jgi:Methyltransferase small domain
MSPADAALRDVLQHLGALGYAFVAPTSTTHERYLQRNERPAASLRDVFGWNMPFDAPVLPPEIMSALERASALERRGSLFVSRHRVATCFDLCFLHGAFPTLDRDSVFFGPDSYRFAAFVRRELDSRKNVRAILDVGAGTGVGALSAAALHPQAELTLYDVNAEALRLARINAAAAGIAVRTVEGADFDDIAGPLDVVIANPPYMADPLGRLYRDGGEARGAGLSLRWAEAAAKRLRTGGAMLLYTGSAIVDGQDHMHARLAAIAAQHDCALRYEEIEPDVWSGDLSTPEYAGVERIAVIGAVLTRS